MLNKKGETKTKMRDFRKLRFNNIFLQLQVTVGHRAPIDNRYTFKYSEGITLVK